MSEALPEDVRRILVARTAAAIDTARKTGGDVPQAEVDSLNRLARLVELENATAPRRPRRAWEVAAVTAGTLVVTSVLLFARVGRTEVELEMDATQVTFATATGQALLEGVDLDALGASGLSRVTLPDLVVDAFGGASALSELDQIRLAVAEIDGRRGTIGISELELTRPGTVGVQLRGRDGNYRLTLQEPGTTIEVGVIGPIEFAIGGVARTVDVRIPQGVALEPALGVVDLDLNFRGDAGAAMASQMPASALGFWQVDNATELRISARALSTVLAGKIYFEELNGQSRSLRAGEVLRFDDVQGEIRTLQMRSDRISLGFHGNVRGMSTGSSERVRSLMPNWLDWLRARHGLSLLWATALYVAGLVLTGLRWFKGAS